jgi:hypothetical protein
MNSFLHLLTFKIKAQAILNSSFPCFTTVCGMRTVSGCRLCDLQNYPVTLPCLLHFPLYFLFINICSFRCYRSVRDQVLHPFEVTGKVVNDIFFPSAL